MIYTDMKHLARYRGMNKNLDAAIEYLAVNGLHKWKMGSNELDGGNVFINRFDYTTVPEEDAAFEAHLAYADIHLLRSGRELIGVTPVGLLEITGTDREADNMECCGPVETYVPMEPGKVLIVFPEDAHMVKIRSGKCVTVEKAVVKVRVQ